MQVFLSLHLWWNTFFYLIDLSDRYGAKVLSIVFSNVMCYTTFLVESTDMKLKDVCLSVVFLDIFFCYNWYVNLLRYLGLLMFSTSFRNVNLSRSIQVMCCIYFWFIFPLFSPILPKEEFEICHFLTTISDKWGKLVISPAFSKSTLPR